MNVEKLRREYDGHYSRKVGRDSSVDIATRYELDGPGIEFRWGRDFQQPSRPALGPTQPPVQMGTGSFPGVKRPGRRADQPPPFSAKVKERVEIHLYSPSGPSWPVLGWTLPIPLIFQKIPFLLNFMQGKLFLVHLYIPRAPQTFFKVQRPKDSCLRYKRKLISGLCKMTSIYKLLFTELSVNRGKWRHDRTALLRPL